MPEKIECEPGSLQPVYDVNGVTLLASSEGSVSVVRTDGSMVYFSDGSSADLQDKHPILPDGFAVEGIWQSACGLTIEGIRTGAEVVIKLPPRQAPSLDFLQKLPPIETVSDPAGEAAFEEEMAGILNPPHRRSRT